jgi:hypothetical protein
LEIDSDQSDIDEFNNLRYNQRLEIGFALIQASEYGEPWS